MSLECQWKLQLPQLHSLWVNKQACHQVNHFCYPVAYPLKNMLVQAGLCSFMALILDFSALGDLGQVIKSL